jgi:3-oxoacyl-[acyl-carrier-protein] synthase II
MQRRRVVVTGLGVVSSIGFGAPAFLDGLRRGRSGISPIRSLDTTGFPHANGGEVRGFDPHLWFRRLKPEQWGRSSQFSVAAARMAVEDAGIDLEFLQRARAGSCVGTTEGESAVIDQLAGEWVSKGPEGLSPSAVRQAAASRLAIAVNRELQLQGEATVLSTACSAGNYAIGHAFDLLQTGEADFMVCGGADTVSRKSFAGFFRLGAIAPEACCPFDANRQGILTGEGSGMLFLETLESARVRGARIYAEVLGYGLSCDANHMVAPDPASIAACMRRAHANAGVRPDQIDYISAHGTGTRVNDTVESAAIREVFGDRVPPTSSIKSMIGHTMGAASALAAVACCLAIDQQFLPPTINLTEVDRSCIPDPVPNAARSAALNVVQNNGFAFGGNNGITIFGRESWATQHLFKQSPSS